MRWILSALIVLLGGCHGWMGLERSESASAVTVMPAWQQYRLCLTTSEPVELIQIIDRIERVGLEKVAPPEWMRRWGSQVLQQPLRMAVDPQALGAACTLRAATVLAQQDRVHEARALFQHVVSSYAQPEWAYYRQQATEALSELPVTEQAVVATHATALMTGGQ